MPRLGEILVAKGVISTDAVRSGLEACKRNGGRLGTWLVRLGFINETVLLEALSEQTGCPTASTLELATVPAEIRNLIPAAIAKRHLVVAFSRQGRSLDVAMINPNDLLLVDEIASVTRLVVRPHVATEAALAAALAIPAGPTEAFSVQAGPRPVYREWRQFWRLDSAPPDLFRALESPTSRRPAFSAASFPALGPLGAAQEKRAAAGLDELGEALAATTHRDQVSALALSYLATLASRVALFSVHQGKVMGWAARGDGIVEEDFQTLILPLDRPSVFLNLSKGMDLHVGPVSGGEGNELLIEALGAPTPREAVIAPLRLRSRVVGFAWLDSGEEGTRNIPVNDVRDAARRIGLALEALVVRQKVRSRST